MKLQTELSNGKVYVCMQACVCMCRHVYVYVYVHVYVHVYVCACVYHFHLSYGVHHLGWIYCKGGLSSISLPYTCSSVH